MNQNIFRVMFGAVLGVVALVMLVGFPVVSDAADPVEKQIDWTSKELCKGIKETAHGYKEVHKANLAIAQMFDETDEKAIEKKAKDAHKLVGKAQKYFIQAADSFAKAQMTKAEAKASDKISKEIDKGNKLLDKTQEELNKGNSKEAQKQFNKAMEHYAKALDITEETP